MTREETGWGTPAPTVAPEATEPVAPSKPVAPQPTSLPPVPVPIEIEADHDQFAPPLPPPPAHEVLPDPRSPFDLAAAAETTPPVAPAPSSYEALGAAAAANAALHAAGAPTPLGGVPRLDAADTPPRGTDVTHMTAASYTPAVAAAPAPAPTPTPAPTTAPSQGPRWAAVASGDTGSSGAAAESALYRPRMVTPAFPATEAQGGGDGPPADAGEGAATPPRKERVWPLILVGLVILAGVIAGVAWLLFSPATVEIPDQQVVEVPADRAVEPIVPEDPTPFLAAMPTTAGPWALTAVSTPDPAADTALPDRVAEVQVLTYGDGTDEVTVTARQLYTEEDAHEALVRAAGKDAPLTDATVGSTVVGERAVAEVDGLTTIMWTHGTAYFEATGPADAVEECVALLGL